MFHFLRNRPRKSGYIREKRASSAAGINTSPSILERIAVGRCRKCGGVKISDRSGRYKKHEE